MGSGFSRNKGINISKGEYISFLDSDDKYYNEFALENLYDKAKKNRAIICGGGMEKLEEVKNMTLAKKTVFQYEGFIRYIDYQYDYDYQRYLYNKNFLRKYKLYFPQYLRYQDPPFFIKTMYIAGKFYVIKNITNIYRKNINKNFTFKQTIDMFHGLKECLLLSEKMNLFNLYNTTLYRLNMKMFINTAQKFALNNDFRELILDINIFQIINHNIFSAFVVLINCHFTKRSYKILYLYYEINQNLNIIKKIYQSG